MAFKVSDMADYVQGNATTVIKDILVEGQSFSLLQVQPGVKKSAKVIDIQDDATTFRDGDNTALDRFKGGVKLLDVNINVTEMGISESYSNKKLNAKVASLALKAGSKSEDMPFQDVIMGIKGNAIVRANETKIWRGTAGTASFDGLETQILASAKVKKSGAAGVALTATKAGSIDKVNAFCDKYEAQFPNASDELSILVMSPANFSVWYRTQYSLNGVITGDTLNTGLPVKEAMVPGRNIKAIAMYGMNGSNNLIASRPENFIIGTDLQSEDDEVTFRYESLINSYVLEADYKLGTAIARPEEVLVTKA